jgi:pyruvate dehydrogenase complex dehydrogenase (E1) component
MKLSLKSLKNLTDNYHKADYKSGGNYQTSYYKFLVGGTSGRTTLNGEGLQHEDGHSHILANAIPNCITYDPTYGYEVAVIVQNGIERMYGENIFLIFSIHSFNSKLYYL